MGDSVGNVLRGVQTLRTDFLQTVKEAPKFWLDRVMVETSDGDKETYLFGSTAPVPRKWIDERRPGGLHTKEFDVRNERFENSLSVDIPSLERDKINFHRNNIKGLAIRMMNLPPKLISDLAIAGITQLCWDGQAFYSTAHKWRESGAQSNKHALVGATAADVRTGFYLAREKRVLWKDDQGQIDDGVFYTAKWVVWHGLSMQAVMDEVFNIDKLSTGGTNPTYKLAETKIDPRITGTGFIVEDLGQTVRPFGLQEEIAMRLTNTNPVEGDEAFKRGKVEFGTEWRGNAFYGDPSLSHLVGSLT